MSILLYLLVVIEVVTCFLLVVVILMQRSRGEGLGLAFGAGMSESLFGAQAGNILTRITVILASIFLACTTLISVIYAKSGSSITRTRLPVESEMPPTPASPAEASPSAPAGVPSDSGQPSEKPVTKQLPLSGSGAEKVPPKE